MSRPSRTQARTRFITGSIPKSSGSFFASAPGFRDLQHVLDEMGSSIRRLNNFDDSSSKWYDAPAVFKPMGSENRFVILDNQLLYVSGTGYVGNRLGVGSISPSHKLDVNGDIRIRGNDIRDNSGNPAISMDGSTNVSIPNGTLGVGTTTAQKLVHIYNSATSSLRIGAKTTTEENNALLEFTEQVDATGSMNYGASALYDGFKNKLIFRNHNNSTEGRAALTILRDGGRVVIGSESLTGLDQYLFVSGSKNSQGTTTRGTAAFGGDTLISGSLHAENEIFLHGTNPNQKTTLKSYDANGSIIVSASNGDIKLDAGAGVWHFEEDGAEQLKIETSPDSNDIKFVKTNDNGQFYFNIESGGSEISALQASTDGTRGKVGINFQSGGPTNLLDIKADSNDQGFTVRNASNKPVVQFSLENLNFGRLIFHDEASLGITQIGSRPGMDHYFHTSGSSKFGIGTRTPGHLLDVRSDSNSKQVFLLSGSGAPKSADESTYLDVNFFVSGTIGSAKTTTKGTALFGGDVFISGSLSSACYQKVSGSIGNSGLNAGSLAGLSIDLSSIKASERSKRVDVYLNGVLMLSGSPNETSSGICDYSIDTSSGDNAVDVKFAMALDPHDAIIIKSS